MNNVALIIALCLIIAVLIFTIWCKGKKIIELIYMSEDLIVPDDVATLEETTDGEK